MCLRLICSSFRKKSVLNSTSFWPNDFIETANYRDCEFPHDEWFRACFEWVPSDFEAQSRKVFNLNSMLFKVWTSNLRASSGFCNTADLADTRIVWNSAEISLDLFEFLAFFFASCVNEFSELNLHVLQSRKFWLTTAAATLVELLRRGQPGTVRKGFLRNLLLRRLFSDYFSWSLRDSKFEYPILKQASSSMCHV